MNELEMQWTRECRGSPRERATREIFSEQERECCEDRVEAEIPCERRRGVRGIELAKVSGVLQRERREQADERQRIDREQPCNAEQQHDEQQREAEDRRGIRELQSRDDHDEQQE